MRHFSIVGGVTAVLLGACATVEPINNITNAPIVLSSGKTMNNTQVAAAIMRAGARLGWQMQPEGPGRIMGRLTIRHHIAVVEIEHDTKSYSIKYRDSSNLKAQDGTIHREYNNWVQNLDRSIRNELAQS